MAIVAILGVGLATLGPLWAGQGRRIREQQLLRVGALYAQAIGDYYQSSPGSLRRYPVELQDLVLDPRFVGTRRHLRKLYPDPLAPDRPWGLVRASDGGIQGVFSQDARAPYAQASMRIGEIDVPSAARYSDWKFIPKQQTK